MSQNSSWAKLVSNLSIESDDQNQWKKVETSRKSMNKNEKKAENQSTKPGVVTVESENIPKEKLEIVTNTELIDSVSLKTAKIDQKKVNSPAKIVHTPARSENVDTVDSKKSLTEPLITSWPSLEAASNGEITERNASPKRNTPQSPALSSIGGDEGVILEKGKKWSKLPVQIRFAPSQKSARVGGQRGDKVISSKKGNPVQSNTTPQGEKPKHRKNSRQGSADHNENASTQSTPSSSGGRSFSNRHYSQGVQNRNLNSRKGGSFNVGSSFPDQVPYFYSYYQPVMVGGAPPSSPGSFIDGEQDPAQSVEIVKMWLRGQVEYYYSVENLLRDTYFRKQMSPIHGGVSLNVISGFNRVKSLLEYAKPYYKTLSQDQNKSDNDLESMNIWLQDILTSAIETSAFLHLIEDSGALFVGIKQGWEYWIVPNYNYPISPTKTTSDSAYPSNDSGKVNEEALRGHKASSLNGPRKDLYSDISSVKLPNTCNTVGTVDFPSPPVTPSNMRAISSNSESIALQDTLSDADLSNMVLVIPSGQISVDSHQAEWLNQGLLTLERKLCNNASSLMGTPRFWKSYSKPCLPVGWYLDSTSMEYSGNGSSHNTDASSFKSTDLPLFDHPSCRFFKDCGFSKVIYSAYLSQAISELQNTGTVSNNAKIVLYTFWSHLLRSQFHSTTYILFRDLAIEDYRNGDSCGIDILYQLFHYRASLTENEIENLEFVKEQERLKQLTVNASDLVAVENLTPSMKFSFTFKSPEQDSESQSMDLDHDRLSDSIEIFKDHLNQYLTEKLSK